MIWFRFWQFDQIKRLNLLTGILLSGGHCTLSDYPDNYLSIEKFFVKIYLYSFIINLNLDSYTLYIVEYY
jgi:hypothetical protein